MISGTTCIAKASQPAKRFLKTNIGRNKTAIIRWGVIECGDVTKAKGGTAWLKINVPGN